MSDSDDFVSGTVAIIRHLEPIMDATKTAFDAIDPALRSDAAYCTFGLIVSYMRGRFPGLLDLSDLHDLIDNSWQNCDALDREYGQENN
jgi:hypothetical protein